MPDSKKCYFNSPGGGWDHGPLSIKLPPHLQNLTIRASIIRCYSKNDDHYLSFLSAAIETLKSASSLHSITLEINLKISDGGWAIFDHIDLSSLTDLADSMSFRRIDLHFNFDGDSEPSEPISRLVNDLGLTELMEQGVLVVHLNERAPVFDSDR